MRDSGPDQFAAFVAPHLAALFRVAFRLLRNTADAQDLVQDTCEIACGRLPEVAATESPRSWLLTVLHNRFIDGQRRRRRAPVVTDDGDEMAQVPSREFDPEELLQQYQDEQALTRAFLQLTDMQRTLLSLRAEGHDLPGIETITGIDRRVISARLNRARVSLSRHLIADKRATPSRRAGSKS